MLNFLKELSFYDAIAYFLPGIVLFYGFEMLIEAFSGAHTVCILPADSNLAIDDWTFVGVASYVLGHVAQGIGKKIPLAESKSSIPLPVVDLAQAKLAGLGLPEVEDGEKIPDNVYHQYVLEHGSDSVHAEIDIYTYREAYYRGMTCSLGVLTAAVGIVAWLSALRGCKVVLQAAGDCISPVLTAAATVGVFFCMWIHYERYMRFRVLRISARTIAFLFLKDREPASSLEGGENRKNNLPDSLAAK